MKFPKFKIKFSLLDFVFAAFLLFAIFLRFYHFDRTYDWGADNVRDFLVAKHIVIYHDFKWMAPWAAGSNNQLVNSVFYYYFLAFFYFLSFGNVFAYQLIIAIFSMIVVIIYAYFLGKLLFKDKISQYATTLLFCFIPPINFCGRSVFQPHFVIPFLLMSLYYFLAAFKNKSINFLSLAVVFYFVSLNFHYSSLIILPWVIGMTIYLQYKVSLNKKTVFHWKNFFFSQFNYPSLIIFLNFYFLIINQLMIRGSRGISSFYAFVNRIFISNQKFYLENISSNFNVFFNWLTGTNDLTYIKFFLYLLFFLIFILFLFNKKTFYSMSAFLILLLFPFSFLVTTGLPKLPPNYFIVFYIALPIFLISVISSLKNKTKTFVFLSIFISFFSLSIKQFNIIKYSSNQKTISKYELAANAINNDAKDNLENQKDFFMFVIDDQLDWSSPAYWYYLEKVSNTQLVENSSYKYNIVSTYQESKNVYLVCDNPKIIWDRGNENLCLERFIRNKALENQEIIFSSEADHFSIYRLKLNRPVNRYSVYGLASTRN